MLRKELKTIIAIILSSSLIGCGLQETIFGGGRHESTVPVGDFNGSWKYQNTLEAEKNIRKRIEEEVGEAELLKVEELSSDKQDKKSLAALQKAQEKQAEEIATKNAEIEAAHKNKIEELVQKELNNNENQEVRITLLPLDPTDDVGLGILLFQNSSQRFLWEAKGNRKDTWNVLFSKDNNVYTNIAYGFNFSGFMKKSNTGYELNGALHVNDQGLEQNYFLETSRILEPVLFEMKEEAAVVKMGEELIVNGKYFDEKTENNKVKIIALETKDPSQAPEYNLDINKLNIEDEENNSFSIRIPAKEWEKGKYSLTLLRGENSKSNTISFEVKK